MSKTVCECYVAYRKLEKCFLCEAAPYLLEALKGLLELGRKDTSNPKYDGYYETACEAVSRAEGHNDHLGAKESE